MIFVGHEHGLDFFDAGGDLIEERPFPDLATRNATTERLEDENDPGWPETAVCVRAWVRDIVRQPIYGVDYGPGSVSARFGGGRVPRGAYQFRE